MSWARVSRRVLLTASLFALLAALFAATASAEPLPGVKTRADRTAWQALLHWPKSCERSWRATGASGAGIELWRTREGGHLVAVDCYLGAYQGVSILYLVSTRRAVTGPLRLRTYVDVGKGPRPRTTTAILGNLSFASKTGRLTVFNRARGIGDCGIWSAFRLRARAFVPVEARAKTACDGKEAFKPQRWPKLPLP